MSWPVIAWLLGLTVWTVMQSLRTGHTFHALWCALDLLERKLGHRPRKEAPPGPRS